MKSGTTPRDAPTTQERRSPVDLFFRTLAETNEDRAVSVILSGSGADGSIGIKRINEQCLVRNERNAWK